MATSTPCRDAVATSAATDCSTCDRRWRCSFSAWQMAQLLFRNQQLRCLSPTQTIRTHPGVDAEASVALQRLAAHLEHHPPAPHKSQRELRPCFQHEAHRITAITSHTRSRARICCTQIRNRIFESTNRCWLSCKSQPKRPLGLMSHLGRSGSALPSCELHIVALRNRGCCTCRALEHAAALRPAVADCWHDAPRGSSVHCDCSGDAKRADAAAALCRHGARCCSGAVNGRRQIRIMPCLWRYQ